MKNLIKSVIFLSIFFILFYYIFNILWLDKNSIAYFHDEPKNSFDVVYVGSSNVYVHFNPLLAYDLYGFKTGLLSCSQQPFAAVKYLLKENEEKQKPKLYVIDIAKIIDDWDYFDEAKIRKTTDEMYFSKNRIDTINEILEYKGIDKSEYINYYFSCFIYHNRWKNISEKNFVGEKNLYKGYQFFEEKVKIVPQKEYEWDNNQENLTEDNEHILLDLLEYIKSNNLNVLFVIPKRGFEKKEMGRLNKATTIIEENNFNIINFNKIEDLNINAKEDFYDSRHLNVYGATKYTLYFSKYLKENYDLPNQKQSNNDKSWDSEYKRFKKDFKNLTKKDFNKLLAKYTKKQQ